MADSPQTVQIERVEISPQGTVVYLTDGSVLEGISKVEFPEVGPFEVPRVRVEALILPGRDSDG